MQLTPFEWALILAIGSLLFTLLAAAVGFMIKRLIDSVDRLDATLDALSKELLANYVRKDDFKGAVDELKKAFKEALDCHVDNCPLNRV